MKSKNISIFLAIVLGGLGAHWFYLNKRKAWLYFLFSWTFIPIVLGWFDAILFFLEPDENFNEKYNKGYLRYQQMGADRNLSFDHSELKSHTVNLLSRTALQFLESIYLISTSRNCDIVIGRYAFIQSKYDQIIEAQYSNSFNIDISQAVDSYKSAYYDKELSTVEVSLLVHPDKIILANYYGDKLVNCFLKFGTNQIDEIEKLKRESAKMKRFDKILDVATLVMEEFKSQKGHMTKSEEYYHIVRNLRDNLKESIDKHLSENK